MHESTDVWVLRFDNGDSLGVTHNHPIYSLTIGDWQFAGMLQVGEEILTRQGRVKVQSKTLSKARLRVYNLEVRRFHNFLVSNSGIVVHNNGLCDFLKSYFSKYSKWQKTHPDSWLDNTKIDNIMQKMLNNDPSIFAEPIYTTTKNGKTYLIDGHHRLKAAKRVKSEYGIDIELQHSDIIPDKISAISPYSDIDELINNSYLPNE